jgi:hypothetical protein
VVEAAAITAALVAEPPIAEEEAVATTVEAVAVAGHTAAAVEVIAKINQ